MKKTISTTAILTALLLLSGFALNAANHAHIQKSAKETVRREIIRNITCPDFIKENDVTNQVKAIVQIDEKGNVSVQEINSANTKLIAYVKDQLQNMKVSSLGQAQKFVLVINFTVS